MLFLSEVVGELYGACHQSNVFVKIVHLRRLCSDKDTFIILVSSRANRTVQAFMDIVGGPFNHLVPSDQLDDSLLLGQNLECEASDEFETGHGHPEDSLKNMLSDKDPMFGSASAQFHLLENEDVNFKLGSSAGTVVAFEVCSLIKHFKKEFAINFDRAFCRSGHDNSRC